MAHEFALALLATVTHVALATAVTIHALLTRENPQTGIAWIGLAWLSPYVGAVLYFFFGVNRVRRKAVALTGPDIVVRVPRFAAGPGAVAQGEDEHLMPLAVLGTQLTGRPLLRGNRIEPLIDGEGAYPRMLEAIGKATTSIAFSSYIFHDDAGGAPFVDALIDAHRRGVAVRVLLDGIGAGYLRSPPASRLAAAGVPVGRFLHEIAPWKMSFINLRNHRKILVVDGRHGFTGGMNIGVANLYQTHEVKERLAVQDTHFSVEGPVVAHLAEAFAEDWEFTTGEALSGLRWFPELGRAGGVVARGITSGPDEDNEKLLWTMVAAVGRAQRRIRIVTPYFLPDDRLTSQLMLAALRGVAVEILIPEKSDQGYMDWAMKGALAPIIRSGCVIALIAPPFDHSKLMIVDDTWVLFGSANWDARSLRLNFEFNVECYDDGLAAEINRLIDSKRDGGRLLTVEEITARPIPIRLRDAAMRLFMPYL